MRLHVRYPRPWESVWAPVSEERNRRGPQSQSGITWAWTCPHSGLVGSQVMGTPKNRALCERTNAQCKNVCQCHSGDSRLSLLEGCTGTPTPSAMDGHLWPSSLANGLRRGLPGPLANQIWVGGAILCLQLPTSPCPTPSPLLRKGGTGGHSSVRLPPVPPRLAHPGSLVRRSSWCPHVCQLKASACHSAGSCHCPIPPAWASCLARWVHCPAPLWMLSPASPVLPANLLGSWCPEQGLPL